MGKSLFVFTFGLMFCLISSISNLFAQDTIQYKGNSENFYRAPGKYLVASKKPDLQPLLIKMKKEEAERQKEVAKQRAEEEKYARMYDSYNRSRMSVSYGNGYNNRYGYTNSNYRYGNYGYNNYPYNSNYNYGYNNGYPYYGSNSNWANSSNWDRFGYNNYGYTNYNYSNYGYSNSPYYNNNYNHHHHHGHHSNWNRSSVIIW